MEKINEDAHRLRYCVRMADEHQQDAYPLGVVRPQFSLFLCYRFLPYKMLFPGLPPVFSPAGRFSLLRKVFCGFLGGDAEEGDRAVFHDLGAAGNEIAEIRHLRYE